MSNYLSLEDAAKKLGIPTDKLVELRSSGEVRGFRDGASWKFPENEIDRLQDELPELLASDLDLAGGNGSSLSLLDSDIEVAQSDSDVPIDLGSELNLVSIDDSDVEEDSDVKLVADGENQKSGADKSGDDDLEFEDDLILSGADLLELDSAELQLGDPAILNDASTKKSDIVGKDSKIDASKADEPFAVGDLKDALSDAGSDLSLESSLDIASSDLSLSDSPVGDLLDAKDDLSLDVGGGSGVDADEDSGEHVIGDQDEDSMSLSGELGLLEPNGSSAGSSDSLDLKSDLESMTREPSGLELMDELVEGSAEKGSTDDGPAKKDIDALGAASDSGLDVLSELDLLSSAASGSGLVSGDSGSLLANDSGFEDPLSADAIGDSDGDGLDDALDDDDDLVIADDDDDLVISSAGSDVSVAGDSGINLMSPSDSGLSLESEPLDLAGSSISALDLGAELSDSGSDPDIGGGQVDEEFQLSPSGIGLEADFDSASQVIEVEDSAEAVADDPFGGSAVEFADDGGDVFGEPVAEAIGEDEPMVAEAVGIDDGVAIESTSVSRPQGGGVMPTAAYEVPFTLLQTVSLLLVLVVLSLSGILMTDLVRNMWTFTEPSAPVSSLTNWLIDSVGLGG